MCGLLIQKQVQFNTISIKKIKEYLNTLGNKYCPYGLTKLESINQQNLALKYFSIVRNFIVISEEFIFIEQFFVELKDRDLKGDQLNSINEYIEDCVRTCFRLEDHRPREWCTFILDYFKNEEIDRDEWCNFRFAIIDKILRKAMSYMKVEVVEWLFETNREHLLRILSAPLPSHSIKSLLLEMQIRKAALLLVELLYGNLPKR